MTTIATGPILDRIQYVSVGMKRGRGTVVGIRASQRGHAVTIRCVCGAVVETSLFKVRRGDVRGCSNRECYRRWTRSPEHIRERVLAGVSHDPVSGCWVWTGCTMGGYGWISLPGRHATQAHRVAYGVLVAPIPHGAHVLHRCDNPPCCNPAHLFLGTNADNVADKMRKGRHRTNSKAGELCPAARLTGAQVREIYVSNEKQRALARRFGVDQSTISCIKIRRNWRAATADLGAPGGAL